MKGFPGHRRRIADADRRAAPVHRALATLSRRIAAAVMVDEAAAQAARGDKRGAEETRASFVGGRALAGGSARGPLLGRLSRVGAGGGESLALTHGLRLDAAAAATEAEVSRRASRVARPPPPPTASFYGPGPAADADAADDDDADGVEEDQPPPAPLRATASKLPLRFKTFRATLVARRKPTQMLLSAESISELALAEAPAGAPAVASTRSARSVAFAQASFREDEEDEDEDEDEDDGATAPTVAASAPAPAAAAAVVAPPLANRPSADVGDRPVTPSVVGWGDSLFEGCDDEEAAAAVDIEDFPETIVADSVLAILRRVANVEGGKAEKSQLRVYETGIANNRARCEAAEKKLEYRIANHEDGARAAHANVVERAEHLDAVVEGERERISSLSQQIESLRRMFQQLNVDNIGAVRDYLAPTLDRVDVIDEELKRVAEETGFKISDLEKSKATKDALRTKADVDVVEDKATTFHVDNVASSVTALSLTIGSLAERIIHSEGMAARSAETAQKLEALIVQLKRHILENDAFRGDAGRKTEGGRRRGSSTDGATPDASPDAGARRSFSARKGGRNRNLAPIGDDGAYDDPGPQLFPAFPEAAVAPSGVASPSVSLHKHRISWKNPVEPDRPAYHDVRTDSPSPNKRKKPVKTTLAADMRANRPDSAPISPWAARESGR